MRGLVSKIIIMLLFSMIGVVHLMSVEYHLNTKDLDSFLSFAEEYKKLALKFENNAMGMSVNDIYYSENTQLYTATNNFLQKKKWNDQKFNDFIYIVSVSLEAIVYHKEFGESDDDPFKDLSKKTLEIVMSRQEELLKYFNVEDYSDINLEDMDLDSLESELLDSENLDSKKLKNNRDGSSKNHQIQTGRYKMEIDGDSHPGWGNYLQIQSVSKEKITGEAGLDWGIGPQARMPMDWEKMYNEPFVARLTGNRFAFKVVVAGEFKNVQSEYHFDLTVNDGEIIGMVEITAVIDRSSLIECKVKAVLE